MAILNAENYEKQYVDKPSEKIEKGEVAGRKRLLLDRKVLDVALVPGDEILCGFIPADSLVVDAKIRVDKSLGATGIFQLGHKGTKSLAANASGFISGADAGGQSVLERAKAANGDIFKRFESESQVVITCNEAMDGSVLDGVITIEVEYVND